MDKIIESMKDDGLSRKSVLQAYYARYLTDIRGLSDSSVRHYFDALNNISRRLRGMGVVTEDVYEIMDLDYLTKVRDILYTDKDFIELNERGKRMYSAGLNNYLRFASGEDFSFFSDGIVKLDMPIEPEKPEVVEQKVWKRSNILRVQVFAFADYKCEIDGKHNTFIAESTKKPYMEGHHAIPMRFQDSFSHSLDVYANIICLCPICHRKIHYGVKEEKTMMLNKIYYERADRLAESGLSVSKTDFEKMTGLVS